MGECVKKTHEFLDKALDYLCQIFRVSLRSYKAFLYVLLAVDNNKTRVILTKIKPAVSDDILTMNQPYIVTGSCLCVKYIWMDGYE